MPCPHVPTGRGDMNRNADKHEISPPPVFRLWSWCVENTVFVLLFLTLALFISKSLYNIPMSLMALLGLYRMIKQPALIWQDRLCRAYCLVFLCIWLPMLLALIDAAAPGHSAETVFPYLRFLFAGIYVLLAPGRERIPGMIIPASFLLASFWSLDALIQYFVGYNLAGFPYQAGHITGMFYPRNTIAHILAALSPLYLESLRRYSRRHSWAWLMLIPLVLVILLSGRRAAWIILFISVAGYAVHLYRCGDFGKHARRNLAIALAAVLLCSTAIIMNTDSLQRRLEVTAGLFSLDYEIVDRATAYRLPIWETAARISMTHWVNGVGPRGFRHVYTEFSDADDIWHETGTTHPHQMLLEVMAETGITGILGMVAAVCLFCLLVRREGSGPDSYPLLLALFAVLFPVNTSMAFYGSYWSTLIWWLTILSVLSLRRQSLDTLDEN